jgi:Tfp pilus assembly protein PilO
MRYVEIASTFFLIAIFLFFAIMPTASAISSLIGEIKSKETTSTAMSVKIGSIMQAQESFAQIQEDYSILESSYPTNPNFYQSAATISSLSKEASAPIKQIGFMLDDPTTNNTNKSDTFELSFTTTGTYSPLISYIEKLAHTRRLIDIKSINISQISLDGTSLSNQLNLNVNANLFYLPKK